MCINVHSVNIVKLLTLTLSWIIIIVSFNDTGFGGELSPHSPLCQGYMMEKGSGTLPTLDHLENYQEIFEKWLNFGSPLVSKN